MLAGSVKGGTLQRKKATKTTIRYQGQVTEYRFKAKANKTLIFDVKAIRTGAGSTGTWLAQLEPDDGNTGSATFTLH